MPFRKCQKVIEEVSTIIDGEAGAVARMRFFGHLAMCDKCTAYFEQFKAVREAAAVVTPEDVPGDFDAVLGGVLSQLGEDPEGPEP